MLIRPKGGVRCGAAQGLLVAAACLALHGGAGTLRAQVLEVNVLPPPGGRAAATLAIGGIPVPPEVKLDDGRRIAVLDPAGKALPAGIRILARRPGEAGRPGPARWIHLAVPWNVASAPKVLVALSPDPLPPAEPLPIEGSPPVVRNGALEVVCGDGRPVLVAEIRGNGQVRASGLRLVLEDEDGRELAFAPGPPEIEVRDAVQGGLRWTGAFPNGLAATVRLGTALGSEMVHLSVRLEHPGPSEWADRPSVTHIRSLSLVLTPPPDATTALDGKGRTPRPLPLVIDLPGIRSKATDWERNLAFTARAPDGEVKGFVHSGTMAVGGAAGSLVLARRDAAYEAPGRFTLAREGVRIELLARGGSGPLYGGRYHAAPDGHVEDEKSRTLFRIEGGRWKTFDLALMPVEGAAAPERLSDLAAALATPPLLHADPDFVTGMGRPGLMVAPFRANPGVEAGRWQRMLRMLVDDGAADDQPRIGRIGLPAFVRAGGRSGQVDPYGWFNHGDLPWAEGYCSLHYDWPRTMFAAFLASGDRRFFDRGAVMAAHQRDIDTVHTRPRDRWTGGQRYEKGWWHGNAYLPVQSHQWITGLYLFHVLSGDPGTREALEEAGHYLLGLDLGHWPGLYGARMVGWPVDNLVTRWLLDGDPRFAAEARAGLAAFERFEQSFGGKGYMLDPDSAYPPKDWPPTLQSWMTGILLGSACRYVLETGDRTPVPLIGRVARFLKDETWIPSKSGPRGFEPAKVVKFWAPEHQREESVALCWYVLDGLSQAAWVLGDSGLWTAARDLFDSTCRFHQGTFEWQKASFSDPRTWSPISAHLLAYPNSETKVLGGIGRFGMAHLWIRERIKD